MGNRRGGSASAAPLAAALLLAFASGTAGASERAPRSESGGAVGMQVAIDPQTGQLRPPTREEARQLLRALRFDLALSPSAMKATQHADGTLSVELGEDSMQLALAKVGADGAIERACVDSLEAAEQFLFSDGLEEK